MAASEGAQRSQTQQKSVQSSRLRDMNKPNATGDTKTAAKAQEKKKSR